MANEGTTPAETTETTETAERVEARVLLLAPAPYRGKVSTDGALEAHGMVGVARLEGAVVGKNDAEVGALVSMAKTKGGYTPTVYTILCDADGGLRLKKA
jgi:hypothetical protein